MKRFFLLVVVLLTCFVGLYATGTATSDKLIKDPVVEAKVVAVIDSLADGLKVGAGKLWEVMMAQAKVYMLTSIVYYSINILFIIIWCIALWPTWTKHPDYSDSVFTNWSSEAQMIYVVVMIITGIIIGGICRHNLTGVGNFVTAAVNPSYWAIKEITSLIK
jgi:hypothetical protein